MQNVGIALIRDVFSHGQLYVAFSQAAAPGNIHVLLGDDNYSAEGLMRNVVFTEALNQ